MKAFRHMILVCTLLFVRVGIGFSQDVSRLSERTIMGTARYVGMGGAMTAIGGDPSAVHDNPAGLGLYQRMEVMITADFMRDRTQQPNASREGSRRLFMVPQASWVFSMPSFNADGKGIVFNNVMLSYHRLQTYTRDIYVTASNEHSLGAFLAANNAEMGIPYCADRQAASSSLYLQENGYVSEYSVDWAMNMAHRWYLGAGLHVQSFTLSSAGVYNEYFYNGIVVGQPFKNTNKSSLILSGATCNLSVGTIYRPLPWLRVGFALSTPSLGARNTYTSGTFIAQTDSLRESYVLEDRKKDKSFHMPLHTSTSLAFQIGQWAMLALQYDYYHPVKQKTMYALDQHSLRAGFELVPILGFYMNVGYAFESSFSSQTPTDYMDPTFKRQDTYYMRPLRTHYVSAALGYRGPNMIVQAAYQFRLQRMELGMMENVTPSSFEADTHRIILSIAWHQY